MAAFRLQFSLECCDLLLRFAGGRQAINELLAVVFDVLGVLLLVDVIGLQLESVDKIDGCRKALLHLRNQLKNFKTKSAGPMDITLSST